MDMMISSSMHMPGAFVSEGMHNGLVRPPAPPSQSKAARPAPSIIEQATTKRRRISNTVDEGQYDLHASGEGSNGTSDTCPRTYTLAGQVGMPGGGMEDSGVLRESMYSDSNYRRVLGSKRRWQELDVDATDPARPTPLFACPQQQQGAVLSTWSSAALTTLGGVVGKVWQFCKKGAFGGFYAGGGRGYAVAPSPGEETAARMFEDDDGDGESRASSPARPAVKRRQTGAADDICCNWVMVEETGTTTRPRCRNRNHGPAVTTGRRIRQAAATPRISVASIFPPAATTPPPPELSSASFASTRSPVRDASAAAQSPHARRAVRPSSSHAMLSRPSRPGGLVASPPLRTHRRNQSTASIAPSRVPVHDEQTSPRLDAEARALTVRRKMEEHDTDVRMASFNRRLQDMIRQGREALGTRVHVEGEFAWDDDE